VHHIYCNAPEYACASTANNTLIASIKNNMKCKFVYVLLPKPPVCHKL